MNRFYLICLLLKICASGNAQNKLPATYLFDQPPTAIFAHMVNNDTIVCMGVIFKEGDTIHYQQGAFIAFIDSCGNLIRYRKYFDKLGRDIFLNQTNKIIRTKDGGYCFIGKVDSNQIFIKTNSEGDISLIREYLPLQDFNGSSYLSIHEIKNSFYIVGFGFLQNPYGDDLFLVKLDHEGNQLNYWRFHTPESCEYFQDAIVKDDHIVISASQTNACVSSFLKSKTRIFEVDTAGNILSNWVDDSTDLKRGAGLGLKSTPDGGFIYAGAYNDTFYSGVLFNRLFVTKIDSNKKHEWTQVLGYRDGSYNQSFFNDIVIDPFGNYIVAGQYKTGYPDFPTTDKAICAIVTKISPAGEILWTNIARAFESGPDTTMAMLTTNVTLLSSGNIITGGYLYRFINFVPQNEGWLAKISPDGEVLDDPDPFCGLVGAPEPVMEFRAKILCFPNPADDFVEFDLTGLSPIKGNREILIYNLLGEVVVQNYVAEGTLNVVIDISALSDGIYIYKVEYGRNQFYSAKLIIKKA